MRQSGFAQNLSTKRRKRMMDKPELWFKRFFLFSKSLRSDNMIISVLHLNDCERKE